MQIINKQDVQARAYGDYSIRLYFYAHRRTKEKCQQKITDTWREQKKINFPYLVERRLINQKTM